MARVAGSGGGGLTRAPAGLRFLRLLGVHDHVHGLDLDARLVGGRGLLQVGEDPCAVRRAFHGDLPPVAGMHAPSGFGGGEQVESLGAELAGPFGSDRGRAAQTVASHVAALAHAHEQQALDLAGGGIQQLGLVALALEVAAGGRAGDHAARRLVEGGERIRDR